jgi:hypothetical protein
MIEHAPEAGAANAGPATASIAAKAATAILVRTYDKEFSVKDPRMGAAPLQSADIAV